MSYGSTRRWAAGGRCFLQAKQDRMDTDTSIRQPDSALSLGSPVREPNRWQRWVKWLVIAAIVLVVLYFVFARNGSGPTKYVTQEVTLGDLTVTVTATGNLEPRNQVDIGSELSGTIRAVNVDVNDEVKAGQVLAVLDTTRLRAQVLQAESSLASADARVLQSDASEKEARANLARLMKVRELSNNRLPSQQDLDVADAAVARAAGEVAAARAAVAQARANLEAVRTDLSKTDIRSPINGVVLVRSVELGQTVAASLQAPILFTLAEDLKKMELHVSVDEADVGSVEVGQQATFTVDAFPSRAFSAKITQVHFASSNTQSSSSSGASSASATATGVVTYETVLEVDNSELLLRPGMTATAEIVTTNITDAVLVPNAALRFTPEGAQIPGAAPAANQQRSPLSALMPRFRGRGSGAGQQSGPRRIGRAWILEGGEPALALFRAGASDGRMTQVLPLEANANLGRLSSGDDSSVQAALRRKLEPGTPVIIDAQSAPKK
jgi:HlyD family secretion protein